MNEYLKEISLEEMREKIEELHRAGLSELEYRNLQYLAWDFIPNNKCKICHKNPPRIMQGSTSFTTLFTCRECERKKVEG